MKINQFISRLYALCENDKNIVRYILLNAKYGHKNVRNINSIIKKDVNSSFQEKDYDQILEQIPKLLEKFNKIPGSSSDPMGKIAWPSRRLKPVKNNFEFDTKLEEKIDVALQQHFDHKSPGITPKIAEHLKDFLSKGLYDDVIKKPEVDVIYRGMGLSKKMVENFFVEKLSLDFKKKTIKKLFKYIPRKSASSWSTSLPVAEKFANNQYQFMLILIARVNDNDWLLDCDNGLYKVQFTDKDIFREHEIIALGSVNVQQIQIINHWGVNIE